MDDWPFRLKDSPEDFRVVERSDFPMNGGRFAVYRLRSRNIGTLEALDSLLSQFASTSFAFGGLKDKYAVSEQFVTVEFGRPRNFSDASVEMEHLGQSNRHFESKDINANAFSIVLRDIDSGICRRLEASVERSTDWQTPNYFDEQRFGSLGESGVFAAEPWCRGVYEHVVRLILTDPNIHDESGDRREKQSIAEHWNAWHELPRLHDPVRHDIVSHLANRPGDFRGAIARIPHSQRSLLLSAFQSAIWNRLLSSQIATCLGDDRFTSFPIADGSLAMPRGHENAEFLGGWSVRFPTARQPIDDAEAAHQMATILASYNLEYRELRVKYPRDTFFSKGERAAGFQPRDFKWDAADDDRFPGRKKLRLEFEIPRGCYATMFIRRIAASL